MASESVVGDDGPREKQRYAESKVYTRKAFKGLKNRGNGVTVPPPPPPATTVTTTASSATVTAVSNNGNCNGTVEKRDDKAKDSCNEGSVQLPAPEDGSAVQPVVSLRLDVVSDDLTSLNRRQDEPPSVDVGQKDVPGLRELGSEQGPENRVKVSLASRSKLEKRELRRKLKGELVKVRSLVHRIQEKQGNVGGNSKMSVVGSEVGAKRAHSEVASVGVPGEPTRLQRQLSVAGLENSQGVVSVNVEKEKRTPKANQFYRNSEFLLAKDKFPPAESNKKSKSSGKKHGGGEMRHALVMESKYSKSCSSLLEKLMKHKHGWVFNSPVDAEALGLHDYFTIITHPMDLGTVKSRLNSNWYKSPKEFAEDVRLTFHNAMTYNPKGQDVHVMAEQLSELFEERWAIIESNYNRELRYGLEYGAAIPATSPLSRKAHAFRPPPLDMRRILDRSESMTQPSKLMNVTPSSRTPALKKPKARDLYKRDMTYEEKQKLSTHLQSLPSEKLDAIVQIIKKRNSALSQHDDEIEVDIDSVDNETLWELDRFVTNFKKSLSKNKRKAELAIEARARAEQTSNKKKKEMFPPPCLCMEKFKWIMGARQVVQVAQAVTLVLHQVILTVIVLQRLGLM
ncbi:transcription factor GTE4-like isoform X2 [Lotus japonicus]|uniref:transcription factor GTE4-like isoform X2 n=1 Tax=Lotus japonicus TaxID=34305 RepID=UPI002590C243|nr:transcription factor GTE4-like isoform X2 [Lotus japonicus]